MKLHLNCGYVALCQLTNFKHKYPNVFSFFMFELFYIYLLKKYTYLYVIYYYFFLNNLLKYPESSHGN